MLLAILSGILIGTSYIPFPPWAVFFCFVPLWVQWIHDPRPGRVFLYGWVTQFVLTLIGFNWVAYTALEFGHIPIPLNVGVLLLFAALAHLHIPLAGWLWALLHRRYHLPLVVSVGLLPAFHSLSEMLFPMIFNWHLGYTWLWAGWPGFHFADIIGFEGLSAMTFLINAGFLWAWLRGRNRPALAWAISTALFVFAIQGAGWLYQRSLPSSTQEVLTLKVAIVQANIGNQEKQFAKKGWGFRDNILASYLGLTEQAVTEARERGWDLDFAVWPETAFPELLGPHLPPSSRSRQLFRFLEEQNLALVTGTYSRLPENQKVTNALVSLSSSGSLVEPIYHKTVLLAFGEYLPGASWFPQIKNYLPQVADFGRGDGPLLLQVGRWSAGAQICYEGLFPSFSRELALQGAQFIVNVTNDSWFGTWQEPYQHLYMTLARAIEVRRPLIRSTNTGISTVYLPQGQLLESSPFHEEWWGLYEIPISLDSEQTWFTRGGIHAPKVFWALWLMAILGLGLSSRSKESSTLNLNKKSGF